MNPSCALPTGVTLAKSLVLQLLNHLLSSSWGHLGMAGLAGGDDSEGKPAAFLPPNKSAEWMLVLKNKSAF